MIDNCDHNITTYWTDVDSAQPRFHPRSFKHASTLSRTVDLFVFYLWSYSIKSLRTLSPNRCFYSMWRRKTGHEDTSESPLITPVAHEKDAPQRPPISSLIQHGILSSQGVPFAYLFKRHQYLICERVAEDHKSTHKGPQAEYATPW